ncbi:ATP-binding protein [Mycoplasmatota bacterium]|nr:ATP-binding protein [Mycoplasmatota bacterium]
MIINFNIGNYKSFGVDQNFTMVPGRYRKKKFHVYESSKYKALKLSAIFGGNASGKSNFVDALNIFKHMVVTGKVVKTLRDYSFRLANGDDKVSKFELEIALGSEIYAYGIAVDTSKSKIVREYLIRLTKGEEIIYDLDYENEQKYYDEKIINKNNKQRVDIYIQDLKNGELLLNKLSSSNLEISDVFFTTCKNIYDWFKNKLTIIKPNSRPINILGQFVEKNNKKGIIPVIELIKSFDTGITDYKYEILDVDSFLKKIKSDISSDDVELYTSFEEDIKNIKDNEMIEANIEDNYYRISFNKDKKQPKVELLTFEHCFKNEVRFSFNDESDGTMRLIELVNILYSSQFEEKVFVIDEIDRSLHPNLTIEFINKFINIIEDKASQMIITTHETNVMNLDLLRQDEIWIIERNNCGMSSLISLNKYNIRSDKVLDKDYLRGRYGGIPNIEKLLKSKGISSE